MPRAAHRDNSDGNVTRQRILAMAGTLFAEYGYAATSVRMIARALDITDPAIHYHFATKQDLFDALLAQPHYGTPPLVEGTPVTRDGLIEQALHLFGWWTARPEMGRMLLREQLANDERSVAYLAAGDEAWEQFMARPIREVYGPRGTAIAGALHLVVAGAFWDAILSYGARVDQVLAQPLFRSRVRSMIELVLPPAPGASS